MEELTAEELDAVLRAPQPKSRKTKNFERDIHTWFFEIVTLQGQCENSECTDPRKNNLVYVWEHPSGVKMCRYCFFDSWEPDGE